MFNSRKEINIGQETVVILFVTPISGFPVSLVRWN